MPFVKWRKFQVGASRGRAGFIGLWLQTVTPVGNVGVGADDLQSLTMELASLYKNGQAARIRANGRTAANGNNKTLRLLFGGTAILTTGAIAANNKPWWVEAIVYRTGVDVQVAFAWGVFNDALIVTQRTALTIDDGAAIIVKTEGTGTADNDIQSDRLAITAETV